MENDEFKAYVRRVSFDISLTGPQCLVLVAAYRKLHIQYGHFVPAVKGLERKGFITHTYALWNEEGMFGRIENRNTGLFSGSKPCFRLTDEGRLLAALVEKAEIPEIENLLKSVKAYKEEIA
ncbi:MAG: hypothetical protein DI551_05615 [Micavibrio aeruginosavorus]|uniref:MarR family transcriptional regulator n=1 Tax=Micavibrio aeruginosavorus TaxID=349221 RepID=A0A2W5MY88_9BACT|nr:MAG: hypothetical protein DI551_05615 [Micavibrio aeruginosavorus]